MLKRYWFQFAQLAKPSPINLGCGVTAYNKEDAIEILKNTVFLKQPVPEIINAIENVDISTLDRGHVIPNMESPVLRGVWYPKGFTELR